MSFAIRKENTKQSENVKSIKRLLLLLAKSLKISFFKSPRVSKGQQPRNRGKWKKKSRKPSGRENKVRLRPFFMLFILERAKKLILLIHGKRFVCTV